MDWFFYGLAFLIAVAITASAVWALRWAVRRGQFRDLDRQAEVIFDDEEPLGQPTDHFPGNPVPVVRPPTSSR